MTTNPSCFESDWLKRTVRYSGFVWVAILLSCFTAIAQANSGAGDDKDIENAAPAPRKALVIVAADYVNLDPVPSASLDGISVKDKLESLGFEVIPSFNDPATEVWRKIRTFHSKLTEGDLAVVYFSGHGFQSQGLNFFTPVDVPATLNEGTNDVTEAVVPIWNVIQRLSDMKVGLGFIIVDACRTNKLIVQPVKGEAKSVGENGFIPQKKPWVEILIAYAADFGQIAWGSKAPNENSLYTKHLVDKIGYLGRDIYEILARVRAAVRFECNCDQDPRVDKGGGTFYPRPSEDNKRLLRESWLKAYYEKDASLMIEFLSNWPVSEYSASARRWLAEHRGRVPSGGTFAIKKKYFLIFPSGYSVIKGETLAPMVATTEDPSKGQLAIVAVDNLKVFSQPIASAGEIATLRIGETVWILEPSDSKEKSDKGTSIWSKISIKTGKDSPPLVGYVKDAVRINDDLQYTDEYEIKLKPTNKADLLDEKVLVSALGGKDLPQPISLIDAISSQSSGLLNQLTLSQSSILVRLHNYIEGAQSTRVARQLANLRKFQIRDALIASGAKKENIFIEEPKVFLLGDEGKPGHDEVNILLAK